jgi:hypothetical protein
MAGGDELPDPLISLMVSDKKRSGVETQVGTFRRLAKTLNLQQTASISLVFRINIKDIRLLQVREHGM